MSWPKSNPNSGYVKITNGETFPNFIKQNTQRNQGKEKRNKGKGSKLKHVNNLKETNH
jgi:hypothetical protein